MWSVLWDIIPLGLGAAFTPSLLSMQILATSSPKWQWRSFMVFLGTAVAFGIACTVLFLGVMQLPTSSDAVNIVGGVIRLVVGVGFIVGAIILFLPHPEAKAAFQEVVAKHVGKAKLPWFFGIAFVLSIKDVTSFALLVPGLHDIASGHLEILEKGLLILILFGLALLPVLIPPLWRIIRGEKANAGMKKLYDFTLDNQLVILGVICSVFAVYCVVTAFGEHGFGLL